MRKTCLDLVHRLARQDPRIFFIGSDLGFGVMEGFKAEAPERFFMEGVSEANVVGMAAGLALEGKIPYVNTIATFLTRRCFEQIAVDLCMHDLKVRLIGNGGGLVYAPLGPTHLATDDIAILRALPRMTIVAPADADEMRRLTPLTVDHPGPVYIRLGKGNDPIVTRDDPPFRMGAALPMRQGRDALIVTTGVTLRLALAAAESLAGQGIDASVLHAPFIKPFDADTLLDMAAPVRAVVTVEEHSVIGGLGSAVAEALMEADSGRPKRLRRIGLPDVFPDRYGSQDSLMLRYGISVEEIVSRITELLQA